jgi:Uma2 family endonuclease
MSELYESEHEKNHKMPSINHSYLQTKIVLALAENKKFTPFVELSLDASQIDLSQFGLKAKDELVPDVCLYKGVHKFEPLGDASKRSDMPLLVVEVLSPTQSTEEILAKFKAYFALGVKSCWLVIPATAVIAIYSTQGFESFGSQDTEIFDKTLDIHLSIQNLWG